MWSSIYCYSIFADLEIISKYKDFLFTSLGKLCMCPCVKVNAPVHSPVEVRGQCLVSFSSLYAFIFETGSNYWLT